MSKLWLRREKKINNAISKCFSGEKILRWNKDKDVEELEEILTKSSRL